MRENIRAWLKLLLLLTDEAIVVFAVLFVLWKLGIQLHIWVLAALASVIAVIVFLLHRILLPVLKDGQMSSASSMFGLEGEVITRLSPEGIIKVRGEFWKAVAIDAEVEVGQRVTVERLEGLKLLVKLKTSDMES